jgi:hypothetical protein
MFTFLVLLFASLVVGDIACLKQFSYERGTTSDIQNMEDARMYWPFSCEGACPCVCPDEQPQLIFSASRKEDGSKLTIVFTNEGPVPTTPTVVMISWEGQFPKPFYHTGAAFAVPYTYFGEIRQNISVVAQALCHQDFHMIV